MHDPVLYQEILRTLRPRDGGFYVDGTVGAGGHAWGILQASSPSGKLLGFDLDPQALELARKRLSLFGDRATLVQDSYTTLGVRLESLGVDSVQGIMLDLGLSSMQLDTPERGFSWRDQGPLDMRFDPRSEITAADLVNNLPEHELANLIYRYGEERRSRQVAREIVAARPLHTTQELKDIVAKVPRSSRNAHVSGFADCHEPGVRCHPSRSAPGCGSVGKGWSPGSDLISFFGRSPREAILPSREQ